MSDKITVFTTVTKIVQLRLCKPKPYLFILLTVNVRILLFLICVHLYLMFY